MEKHRTSCSCSLTRKSSLFSFWKHKFPLFILRGQVERELSEQLCVVQEAEGYQDKNFPDQTKPRISEANSSGLRTETSSDISDGPIEVKDSHSHWVTLSLSSAALPSLVTEDRTGSYALQINDLIKFVTYLSYFFNLQSPGFGRIFIFFFNLIINFAYRLIIPRKITPLVKNVCQSNLSQNELLCMFFSRQC